MNDALSLHPRWRGLRTLAGLVLATVLAGCGATGRTTADGKAPADAASFFTVPEAQLGQLQIAEVARASWATELQATGTVDWDEDRTTQAITQVSGPITRLAADLGSRVKAGDPLLYVASPDLTAAISAYRKAVNRLDLARRTLERNRDLLEHHALAQRDLEASQADYNDAFTEVSNDGETLRILGLSDRDVANAQQQDGAIRRDFPVRAPIAGVVVQKLVLPGQLVQAGVTQCFVISDTATVWVQAHIYETDLASVGPGDRARVVAAVAARPFDGRVAYVGAALDPATRTAPVRIVTANRGGLLKKDAFVNVAIEGAAKRDVLTVPVSAVLYNADNFPFVYLQVSPGRFAQRLVGLGPARGDRVAIASGLAAGDRIVAHGSVFLQFAETYQR